MTLNLNKPVLVHTDAWANWVNLPKPSEWDVAGDNSVVIYDFIKNHLEKAPNPLAGPGALKETGLSLPDKIRAQKNIPVGRQLPKPGMMEIGYLNEIPTCDPEITEFVIGYFLSALENPTRARLIDLYDFLKDFCPMSYYFDLRDAIIEMNRDDVWEACHYMAQWLMRFGTDRQAVKLGMLLLGITRAPEQLADLKLLARHDEFSFFAFRAVFDGSVTYQYDPLDLYMDLATHMSDIGKIYGIVFISGLVDLPIEVQEWLLLESTNSIFAVEFFAPYIITSVNFSYEIDT